jgi:predicted N-acetyltransferase YhbS
MIEESLQGQGLGSSFYGALEAWAADQGADWMRLGVVVGNHAAERFWARHGFLELRLRHDVPMGQKINQLRTMAKPLTGQILNQYLERVPRDRPDQP